MDKATRILRDMKYARIINLIAEKQHITLEEAMDMLYTSPLFEIIDDGTADLICRSDLYLADEIIRMHSTSSKDSYPNKTACQICPLRKIGTLL